MSLGFLVDTALQKTVSDALSVSNDDDRVCVNAFVEWDNSLVEIEYPTAKNTSWTCRIDCGSHSQHRWSAFDSSGNEVMQLVVKHCSCVKSLIVQPLCRNCENRATWRRPCETPQNVFYILNVVDDVQAAALLDPLIRNRTYLNQDMIDGYQGFKPRVIMGMKTPKPECRQRMRKLAWQIEQTAIAAHRRQKKLKAQEANTTSLHIQELMPVQKMPVQLPVEEMPVQLPVEKMPVQLPDENMPLTLAKGEKKKKRKADDFVEKMPVQSHEKKKKKHIVEAEDDLLSSELVSAVDREWDL